LWRAAHARHGGGDALRRARPQERREERAARAVLADATARVHAAAKVQRALRCERCPLQAKLYAPPRALLDLSRHVLALNETLFVRLDAQELALAPGLRRWALETGSGGGGAGLPAQASPLWRHPTRGAGWALPPALPLGRAADAVAQLEAALAFQTDCFLPLVPEFIVN
jgi:hypothetical protein